MKKLILSLLVVLNVLMVCAFAEEVSVKDMFVDMPDNWATEALVAAVENGLISGSDGYINPDNFMTRAEMAAIISRATDAKTEADISEFTDISEDAWYRSAMAKAVKMKAFNGSDGLLNPEANITRQEAFVVLSRVFGIASEPVEDYSAIDAFLDKDDIADWAKDSINMIVRAGYVGGNEGKINPLNNITRAEFAVVMNRLIKYYIDKPGDYTPETDGNVMIRCGNVNINELTTDKMICVGDIMPEDKVNFNKCNITGDVVVRGGYVKFDGVYASLKGLMKGAVLDVSTLPKKVFDKVKGYTNGARFYFSLIPSASTTEE